MSKESQKEKPMDSALNSAHFCSRRADSHLKYGRYDDAINYHRETVNFLTIAIGECTIPTNTDYLILQREYHEKIQHVIARQKIEFDEFLRRNGLKALGKSGKQALSENQEYFYGKKVNDNFERVCDVDDAEFYSLVGDLKIDENNTKSEMTKVESDDISDEFYSLR